MGGPIRECRFAFFFAEACPTVFTLHLPGTEIPAVQFKPGYSYCLVVRSETQRREVLDALSHCPGFAAVAANGGLISNLRVWENIVLPAQYHGIEAGGSLNVAVSALFDKCGWRDEKTLSEMLRKLPDQLTLYEKRLAAFVRAMLMAPEFMVYDAIHEGLSPREAQKTARFNRVFRLYYPFRTSVLLNFEEYRDPTDPAQIIIQL